MKRTVQSQMNAIIRRVGKIDAEHLIFEAETYICALCDMERKPCEIHAGIKCATMIREGTELELLRRAEKQQLSESYGLCVICNNKIEQSILALNPLAELCTTCRPSPKKVMA